MSEKADFISMSTMEELKPLMLPEHNYPDNCDDKYYQMSLNQYSKSPLVLGIPSYKKSLKSDQTFDKESWESWSKPTMFDECSKKAESSWYYNEAKEEVQKQRKKSNFNDSTLSLHITEYENAVVNNTASLKKKSLNGGERSGSFKKWPACSHLILGSSHGFQYPFEFPRQQESEIRHSEIMNFSASQRLQIPDSPYQSIPEIKEHIRHFMKIIFDKNPDVSGKDMQTEIAAVYPNDTPALRTCQYWIKKFKTGEKSEEDLGDHHRTGRPAALDNGIFRGYVIENPDMTVQMFADHFHCGTGTISRHLKQLDIIHKHGKWVPHRLSPANMARRLEVATDLLRRYNSGNGPLKLDNIVTCDEKWVVYDNVIRRGQWVPRGSSAAPTPRRDLHPRKLLLSFFWDSEGPLHYEFVPRGQTITAALYCQQLDRVKTAIIEQRGQNRRVDFLHDNARPHTAHVTQRKIADLGWNLLPHPPYSPCLSPSDFQAFLSLSNWLRGKTFENDDSVKQSVQEWIDTRPAGFWVHGFTKLPQRWQKTIEADGNYFDET